MKTLNTIKTGILSLLILAASFTNCAAQKSVNNTLDRQLARLSASIPTYIESKPAIAIYNAINSPSFDVVIEAPIEVENWMINTSSWETAANEEEVIIEDWMLNFHENVQEDEAIAEPELALEEWMLNPNGWNR